MNKVAVLFVVICYLQPVLPLQPLIGGSISWMTDSNFLQGGTYRNVTFRLDATFVLPQPSKCSFAEGTQIDCSAYNMAIRDCPPTGDCSIAENFGVLCVAQLVKGADGLYSKYTSNVSQCASDATVEINGCSSGTSCRDKIGTSNALTVTSIWNEPYLPLSPAYAPNGVSMLKGYMEHTIQVDDDVVALVAWLAPRTGFDNLNRSTGLLLNGCSTNSQPCFANECSLWRTPVQNGFGYEGSAFHVDPQRIDDLYWANFFFACSPTLPGVNCLKRASPALETFVPLCSTLPNSDPWNCNTARINNWHSPIALFPDVITVATGAAIEQNSFKYTSIEGGEISAPYAAVEFPSYDLDDHLMTQYSPNLVEEILAGHHKYGRGVPYSISNTESCNFNTTQSFRVDCIASTSYLDLGDWKLANTSSGCYIFSGSTNISNHIKPDFSFQRFQDLNAYPFFTQHVMNTIDFTNATDYSLNWYSSFGQTAIQNVFSMYPCDAGSNNQPPVFVSGFNTLSTAVTKVYHLSIVEAHVIRLYAADFAPGTQRFTSSKVVLDYYRGFRGKQSDLVLVQSTSGRVEYQYTFRPWEHVNLDGTSKLSPFRQNVTVICFAAYDLDAMGKYMSNTTSKTCPSMPLCIKIHIFVPKFSVILSFADLAAVTDRSHRTAMYSIPTSSAGIPSQILYQQWWTMRRFLRAYSNPRTGVQFCCQKNPQRRFTHASMSIFSTSLLLRFVVFVVMSV
eukprot:766710-Hanusia_phi.AAC.6